MQFFPVATSAYILLSVSSTSGNTVPWTVPKSQPFDLQGHRGARGEVVESTLPAFAWAMIDGVTTLELDNGITKDGAVIVWHDEEIVTDKCNDTGPVTEDDPDFPYVGKHIANLTLAQIKTLDCGSKRSKHFPLQVTYPGTKISTLGELFKFAQCADPTHEIEWNIESKINPEITNSTRGVTDFVQLQHAEFLESSYKLSQITYQSFDWRTLIGMKALEPSISTATLIDDITAFGKDGDTSAWLGGLRLQDFPGNSIGQKIAYAAKAIGASVVSPAAVSSQGSGVDPTDPAYIAFTTQDLIYQAHELGMKVKPWTVNRLNIATQLLDWGVDGIITDYPTQVRRLLLERGESVAPPFKSQQVLQCLKQHIQKV